ncbi:DUF5916 domain-containing protein [Rubrivirga litoralis]|uniref:DUF5916 domain-containing protein n=1 Tax=Rubrivirga litoralis TaxID=3075598 RepID=A0ABU3BVE8_9BACT|nr:DUF5916 domain-containing protein [Rubrivirga sp. F394]MDT0633273.1 DUF5916 domain-containing protein [Rubrivirga sp. F394]
MLTLALLLALAAPPGGDGRSGPDPARPVVTAAPAGEGLRVDGVLDEAAWDAAEVATGFVQYEPNEGAPATERTEVRVLRAADGLVVGARMFTADPSRIRQTLSRRDNTGGADAFVVSLDSYNDDRTAYVFGVTAAGVRFDGTIEGRREDRSWDAVWESAVRVGPDGWTAELRIPYSQLRYTEGTASWGVNFQRVMPASGEDAYWAPVTRAEAEGGIVQLFGTLDGVGGLAPRPVLQAAPYTLARAARTEDPDRPGTGAESVEANLGADLKVGLGSNVILDATVNPDFGQVDADPAQLNLSTFERFLSERRPFFLEGTQIFDLTVGGGDGALLYTRRVGGESPIIAAAKVTGRTGGGLSFGALGSATGGDFRPGRFYGAGRLKQELPRRSYVGGGLTAYGTRPDNGDGRTLAVAGAADWALRTGGWVFEGTAAGTARDADDGRVGGGAVYLGFDREEGYLTPGFGLRAYTAGVRLDDVGRFRQTDLLQARAGTSYLVNEGRPVGPFRRLRGSVYGSQTWRLADRTNRGADLSFFARADFPGFQELSVSVDLDGLGGLDVREARGLGDVRNVARGGLRVSYETDSRRRYQVEVDVGGSLGADGARGFSAGLEVDWAVSDRLSLDVEASGGWTDGRQAWAANEAFVQTPAGLFVGAQADVPEALVDGDLVPFPGGVGLVAGLAPYDAAPLQVAGTAFYVPLFGLRDTREAEATLRGQYIVSPTLSLQAFGQLFAARGRYRDLSVLAGPDDLRPASGFPKRRDFAFSAFTGNAVLRWEYRLGSALYVVWSQGRRSEQFEEALLAAAPPSPFETGTGGQFADTFGAFPDDVVLVKLSYLLMR